MMEISNKWLDWGIHAVMQQIVTVVAILIIAFILDYVCRRGIIPIIRKIVRKTKIEWDDYLLNDKVLNNACHLIPPIVIYLLLPLAFPPLSPLLSYLLMFLQIYIVVVTVRLINAVISSLYELSNRSDKLKDRPLKGVYQMMKMVVIGIGAIIIFSLLLDKDPSRLLTGLGASAAILMLVFKDTIMGLVAGVQLSAYDMLRPGDWISMPKYGADGVVQEVTLNTVKVQNWDKTITTIPPYALVSDSFQNWRGMRESGGRRIKRSLHIDMNSIRFCTVDEVDYFAAQGWISEAEKADGQIVNLHVFCHYIEHYLQSLQEVNTGMTLMVRQLQPLPEGLPVELYFFSTDKDWIPYERLFAVIGTFGLRVYQKPSSLDLERMNRSIHS
jgi:miniconductance mechanosensitive channel